MGIEQFGERQPEHEGEKFLRMLGLEEFADTEILTANGTVQARDFLDICGEHARPVLVGFESMSPEDPRYDATKDALRGVVGYYITGGNSSS